MDLGNFAINNFVDVVFYTVILIFGAIGLIRGFVSELFSSLNWVISFLISILLAPLISKLLSPYFSNLIFLDVGARIGVFFTSFIILLFGFSEFFKKLKTFFPSIINRPLGLFFGIGKALFLFGFAYSLYSNLYDFISKAGIEKVEESSQSEQESAAQNFQIDQNSVDLSSQEPSAAYAQNITSNKFPEAFLKANCVNLVVFSGRFLDPIFQPVYGILIRNYGTAIKDKLFKKLEEDLKNRLLPKNNDSNQLDIIENPSQNNDEDWQDLVRGNKPSEFQNDARVINNDSLPSNSTAGQQSQSGYNKNEIQKKDRVLEIINQQPNNN